MPAVLSQVGRDAIRSGALALERGSDRVRLGAAARLSDGGDMVDVDVETHGSVMRGAWMVGRLGINLMVRQ